MKSKRLLFLLLFVWFPTFASYQQQWFSHFQEQDGNVNFDCTGQCFALIGPIEGSDTISLNGTFQGNGVIWYGFLVGQQIVPGETTQINWETTVNQQYSFAKLPFYSQIPQAAQIVFIVQGMITWNQIWLHLWYMDFYQKIVQWWRDFRQMETLTPYSINLRYGVKILWVSIIQYWYLIFLFVALYIMLLGKWDKHKKFHTIFFLWIGIFLLIGIRNLITYIRITNQWIQNYTNPSTDNKTFFDLWDYISFTDKIRKKLKLDTDKKVCNIYINSFQDWPFKVHRESLYLKPCKVVLTWYEADYLIYYHKPLSSGDINKTILIDFNGNYLLQNK